MYNIVVFCLLVCVICVSYGNTVSFITPCKPGDDACVLASGQVALSHLADGIPSIGVAPVDPLVLDDFKSNEGDLQLQFKNLKIAGIRNCKFSKLSVGADLSHLALDMECPIKATGQYKVGGKLLFVPIEGEGDCEITTEKILIKLTAQLSTVDGADGKKHWLIGTIEHEYFPEEQVYYRLDNLFNGDQEKAGPVLIILEASWKEVINTIGKSIIAEIVDKAIEYINRLFEVVPCEEMYIA